MQQQFIIRQRLQSNASIEVVTNAVEDSLADFGGAITNSSAERFDIVNGTNGIPFGFSANYHTEVRVKQRDDKYEIQARVTKTPNGLFWLCAVVGLFLFLLPWIVCILYFFSNPTSSYQSRLADIEFDLS